MKVTYKNTSKNPDVKKIIDLHKYAKSRSRYFRLSVLLNIILIGVILALASK